MQHRLWFQAGTGEGLEAAQAEMMLERWIARQLQKDVPGGALQSFQLQLEERDDPYTDQAATVTWRGPIRIELDAGLIGQAPLWSTQPVQLDGDGGDVYWVRLRPQDQ